MRCPIQAADHPAPFPGRARCDAARSDAGCLSLRTVDQSTIVTRECNRAPPQPEPKTTTLEFRVSPHVGAHRSNGRRLDLDSSHGRRRVPRPRGGKMSPAVRGISDTDAGQARSGDVPWPVSGRSRVVVRRYEAANTALCAVRSVVCLPAFLSSEEKVADVASPSPPRVNDRHSRASVATADRRGSARWACDAPSRSHRR
jgi:hypothetical protein